MPPTIIASWGVAESTLKDLPLFGCNWCVTCTASASKSFVCPLPPVYLLQKIVLEQSLYGPSDQQREQYFNGLRGNKCHAWKLLACNLPGNNWAVAVDLLFGKWHSLDNDCLFSWCWASIERLAAVSATGE